MPLFVQVLQLCEKAGLVNLGHVSTDGTKILANASKHKAMSYDRMLEDEVRFRGEINELLANADAADQGDDEKYGVGVAPEDLPEELRRRESRRAGSKPRWRNWSGRLRKDGPSNCSRMPTGSGRKRKIHR